MSTGLVVLVDVEAVKAQAGHFAGTPAGALQELIGEDCRLSRSLSQHTHGRWCVVRR